MAAFERYDRLVEEFEFVILKCASQVILRTEPVRRPSVHDHVVDFIAAPAEVLRRGYFFARPMPSADFSALLGARLPLSARLVTIPS